MTGMDFVRINARKLEGNGWRMCNGMPQGVRQS
jgi:hypothetical protein